MQTSKDHLRKASLVFLLSLSCISFSLLQNAFSQSSEIKNLIDSKRFLFEVQSTLPQSGPTKQESYGFFLKVSGDTLICYLPYYGRATMPTMNPAERPLDLTSTGYEYSVKENKKGGWEISINPKDQKNVRDMSLTVFDNGSADLYVNSNNLQPISYHGTVTGIKNK
jgi:Domain of unknown function (DUF4251)